MAKYKNLKVPGNTSVTKSHVNEEEDQMAELIDQLDLFKALSPAIRRALKEQDVKGMLRATTPWAMARMVHLAQTATTDAAQIAALKDILDRGGFKPVEKQAVLNMNDLTEAEIDAQIKSLLQKEVIDVYPEADERKKGKASRSAPEETESETENED